MATLMDIPFLVFAISFLLLWLSAQAGVVAPKPRSTRERTEAEFNIILGATLTLLGLIIGFSFSMALSRYDLRKAYEEQEANAIGTEYVRADLLSEGAEHVRELLRQYLDQRIAFYKTRNEDRLRQISATTAQLQSQLWSSVEARAVAQREDADPATHQDRPRKYSRSPPRP